jgi:hypothetical protein
MHQHIRGYYPIGQGGIVGVGSRGGTGVLRAEIEEQGHQRVFDQMERDSSRGCYLGERACVATPWIGIA